MKPPVMTTSLAGLGIRRQGKVRDIYDLGDSLLLVATDRISAFDVVMAEPIPDKGRILTRLSAFWFRRLADLTPNHLVSLRVEEFPPACRPFQDLLAGRTMLVRKCKPLPVECIVRGYLSGSGWTEYRQEGAIGGLALPPGLVESQKLPEPIFTPSTKAELGTHDENISFAAMASQIGAALTAKVRDLSLALYRRALAWAEPRGIIIADTKFEFGLAAGADEKLLLIDEVLTPDSSRFWPREDYRPGGPQKSYDKQYLRDYLESLGWNKQPPPPPLPADVIANTRARYLQALKTLTGEELG
ncbi:MAG: phosphoribosylaminoimidazolesuccinocarboxamide synthase [Deltaproteobacteria bacterium CG07_land_8_20_14_0_80_60_11]|nr:MAG: phosphoribosylaminoimidazolesuccinocarboxamide synthase [Deltaproteobacteria bacterium CG07_land_8_20_14_0_80_60_11]PJC73150.1 MAG: phosphoribosylaminoimidazolesuccinocarboxamide synthase [Syntrophobacterales bacterium CG_4_8_14_3_um_filter_58_8]